ncbi:MAG: CHAT domain-containing protein [Zoogloea sp.]|uniref:CHAT domain-containing protein n=1 Tax=Zoogloea sp. TaxID=49181 RepID=UPI002605712F|nr:CHAT domain-containing protein [Zoogloea sp.]MDD2990909.1 CHAT domain-containing protein [Zoogloea sp.]
MPYPAALGQRPLEVHEAYAALEQFAADYGRDPLLLLMHASVPETLRPDLLNLIRVNFLAAHGPDPSLEADVLFSPLSTALGGGYYRIDPQVRWHCLLMLRSLHRHDPRPRIRRIAELLWRYVEAREHQASRAADPQMAEFLDIQRWVALAFLEPASAAHAFADALRQVGATGSTVALRLGGLASAIEIPLAGQPELLAYARGLDALAGGNDEEAQRLLGALGSDALRVGDIVLKAPGAVLAEYRTDTQTQASGAGRPPPRPRCLVIQAAGTSTNATTGQTRDMEASYREIRTALEEAGMESTRAEVRTLGVATRQQLSGLLGDVLSADTVICDLSARDSLTLYLTGMCLALRPTNVETLADEAFPVDLLPEWLGDVLRYPLPAQGTSPEPALRDRLKARMHHNAAGSTVVQTRSRLQNTLMQPPISMASPPQLLAAEAPVVSQPTAGADTDEFAKACLVIQTNFINRSPHAPERLLDVLRAELSAAELQCVRLDAATPGLGVQQLNLLLRAPLAIVDLSAGLPDVLLQLGLRHGLRPGQTLLLAEEGDRVPPELGTLRILRYEHLDEDVGSREAARLGTEIGRWLKKAMATPAVDSPVYLALPQLRPPVRRPSAPKPEAVAEDPAPPQPHPRVFISYVHEYRQYAAPLVRALKAEGIDVAWDMDLKAGDAWQERLTAMLDEADALVAVAGSLTAGRPNPLAEQERARQQGKRLLAVLIEPITEPAALLEHQVANIDGEGHIRYLGELSEDERPAAIAEIAGNIADSLRYSKAWNDITAGSAQTEVPDVLWTLTIRQRGQGVLQYILDIEGRRIDTAVHFQPVLVDRLLRELLADMRVHREALPALTQLLIPRELASLPRANRYHLNLGPDTATLPWELLLHDLADPLADLFPPRIIRRLDGLRATSQRRQPGGLNALLIGNPQTAGTLPEQEAGLPNLPGAEQEVMSVMRLLHAAGFNASAIIGESASAVMSRLFTRDYRMLLVSGNAVTDYALPDGRRVSGFVLSDGVFLTALELKQMRAMPDVVFLNGCHAGRIQQGDIDGPPNSMVLELLKAGVQAVVAPGWAVDDLGAANFSEAFFSALAGGSRFEEAMNSARQAAALAAPELNTWAAYQAWGNPDYQLLQAPGSAA